MDFFLSVNYTRIQINLFSTTYVIKNELSDECYTKFYCFFKFLYSSCDVGYYNNPFSYLRFLFKFILFAINLLYFWYLLFDLCVSIDYVNYRGVKQLFTDHEQTLVTGVSENHGNIEEVSRLHHVLRVSRQEDCLIRSSSIDTWDKWHSIFGHVGMSTITKIFTVRLVTGLDIDTSSNPSPTCMACLGTKLSHHLHPSAALHHSKIPGKGYHPDVWGPIKTKSIW